VEYAVVISTINAAVEARILSSMKEKRVTASKVLQGPKAGILADKAELVKMVHDALFASKIISYAQGLDLITTMSAERNWDLDLAKIAAIWRGGCIIRARFLNDITDAYQRNPDLTNLMLDGFFTKILNQHQQSWREIVSLGVMNGVPMPAFSASLSYYDSYRSPVLPANLLQAQRDFFGAHTYERTDKPAGEFFHTKWPELLD
jgi:6-phosphogluconate dehydrogenase